MLFNLSSSHLDIPETTARFLFVEFSSAFSTNQPHVIKKLNVEVKSDN